MPRLRLVLLLLLLAAPARAPGCRFRSRARDQFRQRVDQRRGHELGEGGAAHPDPARSAPLDAVARRQKPAHRRHWGQRMLLLDPATGAVQRRVPCADPYQLGFSPDGKLLVVNGLARNQVDFYDANLQLVKRFPLSSMPSHLAYSPDLRRVFITLQGTDRLAAIDLDTMQVVWNQPVGRTPAGVLWHDGKLLVANMGEDSIAVVDPADGRVVSHIHTGKGAHQIFLGARWQADLGERPGGGHHGRA